MPPEVCLVSGHGKEACSCAYGASHGRANELRVACIGFRLLSVLLRPCHCRTSGAHVGPLGLLQRERWSAQRRVASHASGGGHGGRRGMEARAAVACLGAHRRSPEAGERTLVSIEDSTTGHLFPVPRPPLKPPYTERGQFSISLHSDAQGPGVLCCRRHVVRLHDRLSPKHGGAAATRRLTGGG